MNPQRLRRPLRKRTKIGNDDSDADWTIDSEGRSSLSGGSKCALVAYDGQASLRRSISETDLLLSEEEVNQTFACWKEDLVGITGLCNPVVDKLLLANVRDHGWDTEQYLSEVLIAGFEESERKTSEAYWKVFARARLALPCAAPRGVGDVRPVCRERVLSDGVGPCGYRLHSACLAEGLRVQDLHLEQYRARDELPLMQQWPRGRADDRVTLPADLETMDLPHDSNITANLESC